MRNEGFRKKTQQKITLILNTERKISKNIFYINRLIVCDEAYKREVYLRASQPSKCFVKSLYFPFLCLTLTLSLILLIDFFLNKIYIIENGVINKIYVN